MDIRVPEYFCLVQPGPDSIRIVKKVCYTDVTPRCRVALRTQILGIDGTHWQFPNLYEVFFDDTVTVQDSFYVGSTFYNSRQPAEAGRAPFPTAMYMFLSGWYFAQDSVRQLFLKTDSSDWNYPARGQRMIYQPALWLLLDTTGMNADTVQGGDTMAVDTTSISPVADRYTYLMPNPASGQTMLYCSFPMLRVEVYDPAGRCILRRRVDDRMLRLDLSGYTQGTYLVVVHTPAGRTVKRLLVQ